MKTLKLILTITAFGLFIAGCKKNQEGGKATISGTITYTDPTLTVPVNGAVAPYAKVKIAYNATSAPTSYNNEITADANGNYKFSVYKGDYYIYVIYDTGNSQKPYSAGGHVKVGRTDNATLNLNAQ